MLIAISQRNDKNGYGESVDSLENSYVDYLEKFGIQLLIIPNLTKNLESYFKEFPIQAIILSGGNDIGDSELRDNTEQRLLEIAIERKLPVLGICRGMQFINHYFGGQLKKVEGHVAKDHSIKIDGKGINVNSYHNWGVTSDELSSELQSFALSKGGVIEGVYHPKYPIAGIQWHPERKNPDKEINKKLIDAFLNKTLYWKPRK